MRTVAIVAALALATACSPTPPDERERGDAPLTLAAPVPTPTAAATIDNPFSDKPADVAASDDITAIDRGASTSTAAVTDPIGPPPRTSGSSCSDGKRVCGDMDDCEDAVFHLQQCGMSRLDGDSDGTPCERICG